MSDKKHIDRLFQEGFKDFEVQPSDAVWKNIKSKLNQKKKKRRVIPIWWRYAGVAALLLLLLTVGTLFFNNENNNPNPIVDTKNAPNEAVKTDDNSQLNNLNHIDHKESIATENVNPEKDLVEENQTALENVVPTNETLVAKTEPSSVKTKNNAKIASTEKDNIKSQSNYSNENEAVANFSSEKIDNKSLLNDTKNNNVVASANGKNSANKTQMVDKEKAKKLINNTSETTNSEIAKTERNVSSEQVSETNRNESPLTIEEALENNKDILKEKTTNQQNKWSIAPNAAPVYFNTLGEGSSIDPQFNGNSKTGELNMSYGISASYAVNNKVKIRSGINKVNLGYNTNDIILYQSVGLSSSSSALQNVSSGNASGYSVVSSESIDARDLPQALLASNTTINQAFGYIEVPLEIQYTLSDKKFGVNVIGGFSSFFLDNNEIYSKAENGPRVFLGEANNINKVSYSANFGLGLNYKVSKKFDLNLEPMFKYQFNTFNNTSGNFTPFFIGVYTGFAIKF